jgi:Glycogen recognition site of AMP-activated protein kinase
MYEYKFIVNGDWCNGPDNKEQVTNPFGSTNNVLVVKRSADRKSHLRAFSRLPVGKDRPQFTSPLGG